MPRLQVSGTPSTIGPAPSPVTQTLLLTTSPPFQNTEGLVLTAGHLSHNAPEHLPGSTVVRLPPRVYEFLDTLIQHWCCVSPEVAALRAPAFPAVSKYAQDKVPFGDLDVLERLSIRVHAPTVAPLRSYALAVLDASVAESSVQSVLTRSLALASLSTWANKEDVAELGSVMVDLSEEEQAVVNNPGRFFATCVRVLPTLLAT